MGTGVLTMPVYRTLPHAEFTCLDYSADIKAGRGVCGCFYVRGETRRTDRWVQSLYVPKGFFTPSFETADNLKKRLGTLYAECKMQTVNSMASFVCRKGSTEA